MDDVLLVDGLYNLTPGAGPSDEYARGVLVGMCTGLLASGAAPNCKAALRLMQKAAAEKPWVKDIPLSRIPEPFRGIWQEVFGD